MAWKRIGKYLGHSAAVCLAVFGLAAAEHHGVVKFGGMPVPGATVTAKKDDKKLVAVTDDQGMYSFKDLADGVWSIEVEMLCFEPLKRDVGVAADAPSPEWELKLQSFDAIKASVPASTAVPASTSAPSGAATTPAANAATATPGAATATATPPASTPSITASAPKPDSKARGKGKNVPPAATGQDSFQKANVNASNGAAAAPPAGGDSGSLAPNEVTTPAPTDGLLINGSVNNGASSPFAQSAAFGNFRRGMRSLYTGNIGATLDNSVWDARTFSLTGQDTPKAAYAHFQGMASFGGPVKIPHVHMVNRPNFTVNYQWMRNRSPNTTGGTGLMPTVDERAGNFAQAVDRFGQPLIVNDPTTGQPFPNDTIPQNRISDQAKALLGLYPQPNFVAGNSLYNYQIPLNNVTNQDSLQTRVNKMINMKNQVNGTFAFQHTTTANPSIFGFTDDTSVFGVNATANWSHRFSQRVFGNLGINYNRYSVRETPYFANRENISGEAGITGNNQQPVNWGPPSLGFTSSGINGLSDAQYFFNRNQTAGISASVTWNRNPHNFSFGADYRMIQNNPYGQQNPRGSFGFNGTATQSVVNGVAVPGTGSDFADFLLGIPDTSALAFGNADKYFRSGSYDAYMADDWRLSPGLTLNMGLRWEYNSPITELYGRLVNLDIAPGYSAIEPVVANHPIGPLTGIHYPDSLVHPDKHAFQPRIGIAWRPFPASSMVIRAGYSITYNTSVYQSMVNQMSQQYPLSTSLSIQNSATTPLTLANPFTIAPGFIPNTFAVDPNFRIGYAQSWDTRIQRDLPGGLVMTAIYLGIKGTRQTQEFLPNTYPTGAISPAGYVYLTSNGNSIRNAGTFQLRRRLHNGVTAQLQYTFAKSIDDAALGGAGGPTGGAAASPLIAQNWLDLRAERSLSTFDQRHQLNLTAQYSTGVGLHGGTLLGGFGGAMFKDWTITTNITIGSGLPLTPIYPGILQGSAQSPVLRPEYIGGNLYAAPAGLFLNPQVYAAPPAGEFGDAARDSITGPSQFSLNASAMRTFRLSDRFNADLRFDATNALNHVVFLKYQTTINPQFGLPAGANGMRDMTATFRVRF